ncbi:MAG: GSU2403 family nucleotidyltransferase fold protein [Bacillota bacterium]|nr:GSU2403 family nucleotidyltransferase fold protein [Bacillota bacterium]
MDNREKKGFLKLVRLLYENDCLEHVVLIGSWAEFLYMEDKRLPGYEANIRTLDVDFLVKNLRRPAKQVNLISLAKQNGFLVDSDRLTGVTKFQLEEGLEVEFLISKRGAGEEAALKTNLGITAQSLRHMEMLKENTIVIDYFGMKIEVPSPEAFVLHKMIINRERKQKSAKDRDAIDRMYQHLDMAEFGRIKDRLTNKERQRIDEYLETYIMPEMKQRVKVEEAKNKYRRSLS